MSSSAIPPPLRRRVAAERRVSSPPSDGERSASSVSNNSDHDEHHPGGGGGQRRQRAHDIAAAAAAADEENQNGLQKSRDCRLYESLYPKADDLVVVRVLSIEELGVYVQLLEYGNLEGLILTSELSKRRFRSVTKLVRVGRLEVASVVRVDPTKGYVDLSKKRVAPEDAVLAEDRYAKAKKVHLTARLVASNRNMPLEDLLSISIWPLYKKHGHAYDGLKEAVEDRERAFAGIDCPLEIQNDLIQDVRTRLQTQVTRLRASLLLTCTGKQGISAVKNALLNAQKIYDGENVDKTTNVLTIQLVASPLFSVMLQAFDKDEGMSRLLKILANIKESINQCPGGEYTEQGSIAILGGDTLTHKGGEDGSSSEGEDDGSDDDDDESEGSSSSESDEGMGKVIEE